VPWDVRSAVRGWPVLKPAERAAKVENWKMSFGIDPTIVDVDLSLWMGLDSRRVYVKAVYVSRVLHGIGKDWRAGLNDRHMCESLYKPGETEYRWTQILGKDGSASSSQ
jgi:hypothetical protein